MKDVNDISDFDHGFGPLENKLINLLTMSGPPDFETTDELIRLGADLNVVGHEDDENVLAKILCGYHCWQNCDGHVVDEAASGKYLLLVIQYFLDHGFDVNRRNGRYGAQCLNSLVLSVQTRAVIEATKLLIGAGARDLNIHEAEEEDGKPSSFFDMEITYQRVCEYDYRISNNLEAAYQVIKNAEENKSYAEIDSYERIIGKRISRVLIEKPKKGKALHDVMLKNGRFGKCFYSNLFLLFEDHRLIVTPYVDLWTDKDTRSIQTSDVSTAFTPIMGKTVDQIVFSHNGVYDKMSHYTQPVASLILSNGQTLTFTTSFGEVPDEKCTAYCYFGQPIIRDDGEPGIEMWWDSLQ